VTNPLLVYCVGIFAASWVLQIAGLCAVGGNVENTAITPWLAAAMFTPALGVLMLMGFCKTVRKEVLWRPTWRTLTVAPYAVFIPTLVAFGIVATFVLSGWGHSSFFAFSPNGVQVIGGPWLLGRGQQAWPIFVCNVVATGIVYSLISMVFGAGEELGWRGYLQNQLTERFGLLNGLVILGLLWSFWHLPLLLAGFNYPENRYLGAFVLSPLLLISASFFLAWLTLRARSFWPAALAHGAGDSIQGGVTTSIQSNKPGLYVYLTELALIMVVGLISYVLLVRRRKMTTHVPVDATQQV
jgi:membrane protease YdiL (CAAX protease family)